MEEEYNILGSLKTLENRNIKPKADNQSINVDTILETDLGNLAQLLFPKAKGATKATKLTKEKPPPANKKKPSPAIHETQQSLLPEEPQLEPVLRTTRSGSRQINTVAKNKRRSRRGKQADVESTNTFETTDVSNEVVCEQQTNQTLTYQDNVQPATKTNKRASRRGRRGQTANAPVIRDRYVSALNNIVASLPVTDVVDLISSPLPPLNGMVFAVDSDIEDDPIINTDISNKMQIDLSDDNPELSIKINWNGNPEIFKLRKYQKFVEIHKKLAERENMNINEIVLILNNKIVAPNDTPASINYKIYQFLSGRVLSNCSDDCSVVPKRNDNKNNLTLKIQSESYKHPMIMSLAKSDKFKVLYIKCAEELSLSPNQLVLKFNGEVIEYEETPDELEFEGDEAIDLIIKK